MTETDPRGSIPRAIPQLEIDEERRRLMIVEHEIWHQRVHHVRVDPELAPHRAIVIKTIVIKKSLAPDRTGVVSSRPMISHVKFVTIPTADQDRALKFWTEVVGFRVLTDQPFNDKQR